MIDPKKNRPNKSYGLYYDHVSERFVFEIQDSDAMFPLLIKAAGVERPYTLVKSRYGKLSLR